MKILQGYPIAHGLSAGKAVIFKKITYQISSDKIDSKLVEEHIKRFSKAIYKSIAEIESLSSLLESEAKEEREIILNHIEMLRDKIFLNETITKIKKDLISAEYAVHSYFEKLIDHFSQIEDDYLAQRKEDIKDIRNRIIRNLRNREDKYQNIQNKIVIVKDVTPSLVISIKNNQTLGIITERGAPNSHSAIIAKSIGVPVVFDIKHALHHICNNDFIILNGTSGSVILNPTAKQMDDYKEEKKIEAQLVSEKVKLSKLQTITKDNRRIYLMGNIEFHEEAKKVELQYADGIGLFRTEYLYFNENSFPPAQKQFEVYKNLIDSLSENVPIYIRTFDVGGDKLSKEFGLDKEMNPYLGCRGIRFLFKFPKIFIEQIKGILQASAYGNLKIMLPMISTIDEVVKAKKIINEAKNLLRKANIRFNDNINIGVMIEVPSAALLAEQLAEVSDFFSIGTNDLTQYILAADRNNETLSDDFNYFNPAVLQLIEMTIKAANKNGIDISLCGEMAGDPVAIPLLLGMGLNIFSVNTDSILTTKKQIHKYNLTDLKNKYDKIKFKSYEEIKKYYKSLIKDKRN